MTKNDLTTTRRQVLTGAAASVALVAVPSTASVLTVNRTAWNRAVAKLERLEAEYQRVLAGSKEADGAYLAASPDRHGEFRKYGLGYHATDSRKRNHEAAYLALLMERAKGRTVTDADCKQAFDDANRIVDDWEAYLTKRREAAKLYRVDAWEKLHDKACDRRWEAQLAVINEDAPDQSALLYKIGLVAQMLEGDDEQRFVNPLHADAKRLLRAA